MEKVILKSHSLIAAFVRDEQSPYFQGPMFARVLNYLKENTKSASMYQRNGALRLKIKDIQSVAQALGTFEDMAGMTASQATELVSGRVAKKKEHDKASIQNS